MSTIPRDFVPYQRRKRAAPRQASLPHRRTPLEFDVHHFGLEVSRNQYLGGDAMYLSLRVKGLVATPGGIFQAYFAHRVAFTRGEMGDHFGNKETEFLNIKQHNDGTFFACASASIKIRVGDRLKLVALVEQKTSASGWPYISLSRVKRS